MARAKTLVLIMAGGAGSRMDVLTEVRAKPVLPFAGIYRLIDFPLTNCVHSGLSDVWVIEQFQPHDLNDHLANGRPWDLDRTYGGLRIIAPHTGTQESGWHQGNADAIYRNKQKIQDFAPDLIVVLSADHIYRLDYSKVLQFHLEQEADVTMVTTRVPLEEASRFGTVQVDEAGKVTKFEYKPDQARSDVVTTEVFVYNAARLLETLVQLAVQGDGDEGPALEDFGHELLPKLVREGRAYAFPLEGYWRDVGVIEDYWRSHMDLLGSEPALDLDDPAWPILTYGVQRMPARIHETARIQDSLISPGCTIRGRVERSVLSPGVVVEEGAVVSNSILFQDTVVKSGAMVAYAILDSHVRVGHEARVGEPSAETEAGSETSQPSITLVGQHTRIPNRAQAKDEG